MAIQYLLPCPSCGRKIPVETGRAGDQLLCECGMTVDVPTMRELRQLESYEVPVGADGKHEPGAAAWAPWQGLILMGALVLLAGLIPAIAYLVRYPAEPTLNRELFKSFTGGEIEKMTMLQSWGYWKELSEEGHIVPPSAQQEQYEREVAEIHQRLGICFSIVGAGLLVLIAGLVLRFAQPQPRGKTAPAA